MNKVWIILSALIAIGVSEGQTGPERAEFEFTARHIDQCVVCGQKFGTMGEPFLFQFAGRPVRLACRDCYELFRKNPGKYLRSLDELGQ